MSARPRAPRPRSRPPDRDPRRRRQSPRRSCWTSPICRRSRGGRGAAEPFDILVNNAGTNRPAPFLEVTEAEYDAITELNRAAAFSSPRRWRGGDGGRARARSSTSRRRWGMSAAPAHGLLHHQAWRRGHDEGDGGRPRAARHSGQLHRSDLHRDADDRAVLAKTRRSARDALSRSSSGGSARSRTSWARSCSSPPSLGADDWDGVGDRWRLDRGVEEPAR